MKKWSSTLIASHVLSVVTVRRGLEAYNVSALARYAMSVTFFIVWSFQTTNQITTYSNCNICTSSLMIKAIYKFTKCFITLEKLYLLCVYNTI